MIRVYAEFEAGLRDYWANHLNKKTHPPMAQLLDSLADQRLSVDRFEDADAVREYRNFLVHDESDEPPPEPKIFTVAEDSRTFVTSLAVWIQTGSSKSIVACFLGPTHRFGPLVSASRYGLRGGDRDFLGLEVEVSDFPTDRDSLVPLPRTICNTSKILAQIFPIP